MSWGQWPASGPPPIVNPAPPISTDMWQHMQQQNWQQWAQWQQQYQQWQQTYGAEFQKALAGQQTAVPVPTQPTGMVPPLPYEAKPPLPPPDAPQPHNMAFPPPPNPYSTLPPGYNQPKGYNTAPPNTYNNLPNQYVNPPVQPTSSYMAPPPTYTAPVSTQAAPPKPPNETFKPSNDNKRPLSRAPSGPVPKKPTMEKDHPEELSEAEKKFDIQFAQWEAQFNKWKHQNVDHPDKEQYKEYEKKWESWRQQLLERREQMRRKRLGLTVTTPVTQKALPTFNIPPPNVPKQASEPQKTQQENNADLKSASNVSPTSVPNMYSQPPPDLNDQPLSFKNKNNESGEEFLKKTETTDNSGIPGLDLVGVANAEEEEEPEKNVNYEALSKGISNILGDTKLMNLLSNINSNVKASQAYSDSKYTHNPPHIIDDQTRSSFTTGPENDYPTAENTEHNQSNAATDNFHGKVLTSSNEKPFHDGPPFESPRAFNQKPPPVDFTRAPPANDHYFGPPSNQNFKQGPNRNVNDNNEPGQNQDFMNKPPPNQDFNSRFPPKQNYNVRPPFNQDYASRPPPNQNYSTRGPLNQENDNRGPLNQDCNRPQSVQNYRQGPPLNDDFRQGGPPNQDFNKGRQTSHSNFDRGIPLNQNLSNESSFPKNVNRLPIQNQNFEGKYFQNQQYNQDKFSRPNEQDFNTNKNLNRLQVKDVFLRGPSHQFESRPNEGNFNQGIPSKFNDQSNQRFNNRNQGFDNRNQGFDDRNQGFDDENQSFDDGNQGFDDRNQGFNDRNQGFDNRFRPRPGYEDNFNRNSRMFTQGRNQPGFQDNKNRFESDFDNRKNEPFRGPTGNFDRNPNMLKSEYNNYDSNNSRDNFFNMREDNPVQHLQHDKYVRPPLLGFGPENREDNLAESYDPQIKPLGRQMFSEGNIGVSDMNKSNFRAIPDPPNISNRNNFEDDQYYPEKENIQGANWSQSNQDQKEPMVLDNSNNDIWIPTKVIEYSHKSKKLADPEVMIEPYQMFDYRHKPLSRIPFAERPKWLTDTVRMIPEFDPPTIRSTYAPPSMDYSAIREESFSDMRRGYDRESRNSRRFTEFHSDRRDRRSFSPPLYEKKSHFSKRYDDRDDRRRQYEEFKYEREKRNRDFRDRSPDEKRTGEKSIEKDRSLDKDIRRPYERNFERDSRKNERNSEQEHFSSSRRTEDINRDNFRSRSVRSPVRNQGTDSFPEKSLFPTRNVHKKEVTATPIDEILSPPGRYTRPPRLVIILRGPPGSGKTYLAKMIKDKEIEHGGSAPRILSLDDYFMVEQEKEIIEDGKRVKVKEMMYEFEEEMEESYRSHLMKSFKKTVTDGYFSFIIVDNINEKVKYFGEMWSFAKQNGFQVYICQMDLNLRNCTDRNIHNRTEAEIKKIIDSWEQTPSHHPVLDPSSLLAGDPIPEIEMEEIDSIDGDNFESEEREDQVSCSSKWDNFDCSENNLARLDGVSKPLRPSKTMEEYLQLDDWVPTKSIKPGQKRVRWADLEEQKQQEKMRAIGFVVGQTDWDRMMDPSMGSSALTQTKYIESVRH